MEMVFAKCQVVITVSFVSEQHICYALKAENSAPSFGLSLQGNKRRVSHTGWRKFDTDL